MKEPQITYQPLALSFIYRPSHSFSPATLFSFRKEKKRKQSETALFLTIPVDLLLALIHHRRAEWANIERAHVIRLRLASVDTPPLAELKKAHC